MNNTPNINLSTYTSDPNDKFNLLVTFNNNMTKIDTAVGAQNDQIDVIEASASTAVTTANTASDTANTALTTANSKASINDNMSSSTLTYSSNKINSLIAGIQPGTEIDDTVTSTTKTWSSSKINTEVSAKASINDTTASNSTTYSSNKIDSLISGAGGDFPDYSNSTLVETTTTVSSSNSLSIDYTATEDCYIYSKAYFTPTRDSFQSIFIPGTSPIINQFNTFFENRYYSGFTSQIFKIKAGTRVTVVVYDINSSSSGNELKLYKIPITN